MEIRITEPQHDPQEPCKPERKRYSLLRIFAVLIFMVMLNLAVKHYEGSLGLYIGVNIFYFFFLAMYGAFIRSSDDSRAEEEMVRKGIGPYQR